MPQNLRAEGRADATGSWCSGTGALISISRDDYNSPGAGNSAFSDIHHESFHWLAYHAYGGRWPAPITVRPDPHSSNTESCEAFAIMEGSASYFQSVSYIANFGGDNKTGMPGVNTWRGADNTGSDNSGEIVEGAYERTMRNNGDNPGELQILTTRAPDTMDEFKNEFATLRGATSAAMQSLLNVLALNGMVYTRGKITGFTPGDPPDAEPQNDGNFKIIRNLAFIRGEIKPTIEQSTAAELRLASSTVNPDQKNLGYKAALANLNEANTAGFTFVGAVAFAADLTWDTKPRGDGDYDLLARTRSIHQWWDTFQPDFTGDATAAVSSNERWLKTLQTWYNQDNSPTNDNEGKVIIDNNPPKVENFKPDGS